jgi:hypothetical protein
MSRDGLQNAENVYNFVSLEVVTLTDCQNRILGTGPWLGAGGPPSSLPAGSPPTAPDPKAGGKHVDET